MGRAFRIPAGVLLLLIAGATPHTLASDPDVTPPSGTLTINGGASVTNSPTLRLAVPATDDVEVVEVRVRSGDGPWTSFPYAPELDWTHQGTSDGQVGVHVAWYDAAGNSSSTSGMIVLDRTAPSFTGFRGSDALSAVGKVALEALATDAWTGVTHLQLSKDGTAWGSAIPYPGVPFLWDPFDTATGGSSALGTRTLHARVRDGAGNWSAPRTATVFVRFDSLSISVSPSPRTGSPITLTPTWPAGTTFPKGTVCWWEVMWGDDNSLYWGKRNDTFGYVMTMGPSSGGWCDGWTFTLPWGPLPRYMVVFWADTPGGTIGEASIGGGVGIPKIEAAVGTTDRRITSSSLPVVYILPDSFEVTVGQPVTYRAYPVGGATLTSRDQWSAQVVEDQGIQRLGGSTFTFVPDRAGHWTVCWGTPTRAYQLAACFDPTVKRATSGGSGGSGGAATSPPEAPTASPAELTWATPGVYPSASDLPTTGPVTAVGTATPRSSSTPPEVTVPAAPTASSGVPWPALAGVLAVALALGAAGVARRTGWRRGPRAGG